MSVNLKYSDMTAPLQGPENPFGDRNRFQNQNSLAGMVEEQSMSEHAFRSQLQSHAILGYAANPSIDPSAPAFVGSMSAAEANGFASIDAVRTTHAEKRDLKRRRKPTGNLEIVEGEGSYVGPWGAWQGDEISESLPGLP